VTSSTSPWREVRGLRRCWSTECRRRLKHLISRDVNAARNILRVARSQTRPGELKRKKTRKRRRVQQSSSPGVTLQRRDDRRRRTDLSSASPRRQEGNKLFFGAVVEVLILLLCSASLVLFGFYPSSSCCLSLRSSCFLPLLLFQSFIMPFLTRTSTTRSSSGPSRLSEADDNSGDIQRSGQSDPLTLRRVSLEN
jgi:hypothetical protein